MQVREIMSDGASSVELLRHRLATWPGRWLTQLR